MKNQTSIALFVICVMLTGCSGGGPTDRIKVSMTDFTYAPNSYTVQAGKEIQLEIANNGAVVHNFIILNAGAEVGQDYSEEDEKNVYWKIDLAPGRTTTTTFTAPSQVGEYQVVCSTPGHYIAGMIAKLNVVE